MKTAITTPPAAESALKTPRVTALVRELYRLKSNTLRYPCETALRQLAEELETENAAAQQRIVKLERALGELVPAATSMRQRIYKSPINAAHGLPSLTEQEHQGYVNAIAQARLALRHHERT